jgi:alpha-aminoadipate carrier protein LysW
MNTQVRIKELSIDSKGDITLEGVEIDVTEKTLVDLVGFFLSKQEKGPGSLKKKEERPLNKSQEDKASVKASKPVESLKPVEKKAPAAEEEKAVCPECASELKLDDQTMVSEILQCTDCGVELEITCLDPLTVEPAPEECEDWGE